VRNFGGRGLVDFFAFGSIIIIFSKQPFLYDEWVIFIRQFCFLNHRLKLREPLVAYVPRWFAAILGFGKGHIYKGFGYTGLCRDRKLKQKKATGYMLQGTGNCRRFSSGTGVKKVWCNLNNFSFTIFELFLAYLHSCDGYVRCMKALI
jgi:hypothetical protein